MKSTVIHFPLQRVALLTALLSVFDSGQGSPDLFMHLARRHRLLQSENGTTGNKNWWEFELGDEILDEVALYYLGQTWHQSADVGEVLKTVHETNVSDPWSWTNNWRKSAERLEKVADEMEQNGHALSASQAYLRAATYTRASLHRHPDPFDPEVKVLSQKAVDDFEKFLNLSDYPCKPVQFPYEDSTLPAYLCLNPNVNGTAPTIIFNEGKDGWAEDGKFVLDEAMKRGYNAFLWDGPGMGKVLRLQGLPFRHDWENVVTPLIDYLVEIPQVDPDNLALISLSLGGYLGPRAAVFEHRLKALIPNPGVLNWYRVYEESLGEYAPGLFDVLHTDPDLFDSSMYDMMEASDFLEWGVIDSMWHHGVDSPSALFFEIERFNLEGMVQNITASTLVLDGEAETRGQAVEFFDSLSDSIDKEYHLFTADEAAQFHDQPGATAVLSAYMFDWLDRVLGKSEMDHSLTDANDPSQGMTTFTMVSRVGAALAPVVGCMLL